MRLASFVVALAACGGPTGPRAPASDGVRTYIAALRSNDAHAAYDLLAGDARKQVSFEEFATQWKQTQTERARQAQELEDSLKGTPDVGERALVRYSDGKSVEVEREGRNWRLDSELVSRSHARYPIDAVRIFADAIERRDIGAVLGVLTERRRDGLTHQIQGVLSGLGRRITSSNIDTPGNDRAELRWDENGVRYRIVLRREQDDWRVDDIYVRPVPKDEGETETGVEGGIE